MSRERLNENRSMDLDQSESQNVDWPAHLEHEMSEYDTYLLLLDDGEDNDYLSSYCSVQRPEYFKIH